jgi:hypothetical protein
MVMRNIIQECIFSQEGGSSVAQKLEDALIKNQALQAWLSV